MNDAFARSMFLAPPVIAGVRLRAFSLYHAFLLEQIGSPYITGGYPNLWDTTAALIVCRLSRCDGSGRLFGAMFSRLRRFLWACRIFLHSHKRVASQVQEHITAYFSVPEMYRKQPKDSTPADKSGAPWEWNVAFVVASEAGVPWREVWDMPMCEAASIKSIADERNGGGIIAWRLDKEFEAHKRKAS